MTNKCEFCKNELKHYPTISGTGKKSEMSVCVQKTDSIIFPLRKTTFHCTFNTMTKIAILFYYKLLNYLWEILSIQVGKNKFWIISDKS